MLRKGLLSVAMYETQVMQNSLSNQVAKPYTNPSREIHNCVESYWNDWVLAAKIRQTTINVTSP